MKAKDEQILIFKDEVFEQKTKLEVEGTKKALQVYVDEWNKLDFGKLQPNELHQLIMNPKKLYQQRIDSRIETPRGLNRSKYIDLVELPDLTPVLKKRDILMRQPFCVSDLFTLNGELVVIVEDNLKSLLDSQNVYLSKSDPNYKMICNYLEILRLLNEINTACNYRFVNDFQCRLDKHYLLRQVAANTGYAVVFDPEKYRNFAQLLRTSQH